MGRYIDHRLVARPELDNTFWTDYLSLPSQAERSEIEPDLTWVIPIKRSRSIIPLLCGSNLGCRVSFIRLGDSQAEWKRSEAAVI